MRVQLTTGVVLRPGVAPAYAVQCACCLLLTAYCSLHSALLRAANDVWQAALRQQSGIVHCLPYGCRRHCTSQTELTRQYQSVIQISGHHVLCCICSFASAASAASAAATAIDAAAPAPLLLLTNSSSAQSRCDPNIPEYNVCCMCHLVNIFAIELHALVLLSHLLNVKDLLVEHNKDIATATAEMVREVDRLRPSCVHIDLMLYFIAQSHNNGCAAEGMRVDQDYCCIICIAAADSQALFKSLPNAATAVLVTPLLPLPALLLLLLWGYTVSAGARGAVQHYAAETCVLPLPWRCHWLNTSPCMRFMNIPATAVLVAAVSPCCCRCCHCCQAVCAAARTVACA